MKIINFKINLTSKEFLLSINAIINHNSGAYEKAKRRAAAAQAQRDEIRNTTREINHLKSEMHEIEHLLKELVGNRS